MSLWTACLLDSLRTSIVVLLALLVSGLLRHHLQGSRGWWRRVAWLLLLAPLISPHLVTGYGYASFAWSLVRYPLWNELFYGLLVLISVVPIGAILLIYAPPPVIAAEGLHCHRLTLGGRSSAGRQTSWFQGGMRHAKMWLRGPGRQAVPAACLMFLIAFQEFEVASLMGIRTWTVWLFDAQAGGLPVGHALRFALLPLAIQVLILFPAVGYIWHSLRWSGTPHRGPRYPGPVVRLVAGAYLVLAFALYCLVPWSFVLGSGGTGLAAVVENFTLARDIGVGCGMALAGGVATYLVVLYLRPGGGVGHGGGLWGAGLSIPGLMGALVLGLCLLLLFQLPGLGLVYDTPLPWLTGLVLFLMPRGMILLLLLSAIRPRTGRHLAGLLRGAADRSRQIRGRELWWRLEGGMQLAAVLLLCCWAYVELTSAAMLAPVGFVPAPVRLYNLMHYGQSSVLSAMVVATFVIPALIAGGLVGCRQTALGLLLRAGADRRRRGESQDQADRT